MPHTVVGLDIGASAVRAAELQVGHRARLRKFASVPLEPGVVNAGAVIDPEALTAALKRLWSEGKFTSNAVALGIANASVLVRQMDLDWMPPADFRKALRYQVEAALPMPVDDANLDYHLLEELDVTGEDGQDKRVSRVLLVAAAREMVNAFVDAADRAGLRTVQVDLVPFALIRACGPDLDGADGAFEGIVDIGADTVNVVVHVDGQPRYVRMLPGLGGAVITKALKDRYGWTWEEAERTKVMVGLPGHSSVPSEGPRTDGLDHPAQQVVASEVESLVGEIATTLRYVRSADDESVTLSRLLLTGAGSRLGGLPELLAQRLQVPVETLTMQARMHIPRSLMALDDESALAIPAGLCMAATR